MKQTRFFIKKTILWGLIALLSSCHSNTTKKSVPQKKLSKLVISKNKRFMMYDNGQPFFWLGDTAWLLFSRLNRDEAKHYINDRAEKGFNVIQVMLLHELGVKNVYGDAALSGDDIAKPLTTLGKSFEDTGAYDYWDHVDYIADLAKDKGMYLALVPVWGSNVKQGKITVKQATIYAAWLAKRFANRNHIIWLNGGDTKGNENTDIWNAIGLQLKKHAPHHLVTFHPYGRCQSSRWFHNKDWLDFNMFQSGHRRYDQDDTELSYGEDNWKYVNYDYNLTPVKPTLDGEPSYEGIPQGLHDSSQPYWNANDVRRYAYWSVFAGASGFTYGHSAIMQMHKPDNKNPAYGVRENWYDALDFDGAKQMTYLKQLLLSKPFFERQPDQSLIATNNGKGYNYQIATRGKDYAFIYTYNGRNITVQLGILNGSTITAKWYNPRLGEIQLIGDFENTNTKNFDPPGAVKNGTDWVLVLQTKE